MRIVPATGSCICVQTQDANQARAILQERTWCRSLRILGPGEAVDFRLRQAQLDRVTFLEVSYGNEVEIISSGPDDFYLLQLTLAGTCEVSTSTAQFAAGPGSYFVLNPRSAYRKRCSSDARQLIIRLPRTSVEQLAGAESPTQPIVFEQAAELLPSALRDLVNFLWRDVTTDGRTRLGVIDRSASRHLVKVVLHLLPNSANTVVAPHELPACLPRADRYIRENLTHDIGLADIADAAGVSTRSLESAFRRHWHTTPVTHIRNLRLDAAHRMLTDPVDGTSVTDAALASGFSHLGRFSQGYSRRFGELPSESLRRALTASN